MEDKFVVVVSSLARRPYERGLQVGQEVLATLRSNLGAVIFAPEHELYATFNFREGEPCLSYHFPNADHATYFSIPDPLMQRHAAECILHAERLDQWHRRFFGPLSSHDPSVAGQAAEWLAQQGRGG